MISADSAGQPQAALTVGDEKNLGEIEALLALPAHVHQHPDKFGDERYSPSDLLALIERWPSAQRFPRERKSFVWSGVPSSDPLSQC